MALRRTLIQSTSKDTMTPVQKYAELKAQISDLESQLDALKPEIETLVADSEGMKLETKYGVFKMMYVPKWKYSPELSTQENLLKDKLKLMKKKEELEGVAEKITDGGRLVFTKNKE